VEIYCASRYFTITDDLWPGKPDKLTTLDWPQLKRIAKLIPPAVAVPQDVITPALDGARDNSRSAIAFRKGAQLRRAGKNFEEMVEALRSDPETSAWCREKGMAAGMRELKRIWKKAEVPETFGISLDDFHAYMPMHNYIFVPARATWPAASVNSRIPPIK